MLNTNVLSVHSVLVPQVLIPAAIKTPAGTGSVVDDSSVWQSTSDKDEVEVALGCAKYKRALGALSTGATGTHTCSDKDTGQHRIRRR